MPRRVTVADLCNRLDGLGIAFFASMSALISVLIELHPDDITVIDCMRAEALGMVAALDDSDQDVFPPAAINAAFTAVVAAFVSRDGEDGPSNDNDLR